MVNTFSLEKNTKRTRKNLKNGANMKVWLKEYFISQRNIVIVQLNISE